MTAVHTPLLATLSLFRAVGLPTLIYNSSTIAIPSIVIIVSYYIAKLIIPEIPIYLLYNYYTIHV